MLDAVELSKAYGGTPILAGATFQLQGRDRLALVGPNGAGKTTLLRILAGRESPDGGAVRSRRGLEVGYLPQEIDASGNAPLIEYLEDVAEDLRRLQAELAQAEARMADGEADPRLLERYGELRGRFEHLGGYQLRSRAERILAGLGFGAADHRRPLSEFSGGWRMRAALARILLREPDLVLLDEPTNHLDIVTLEWLEEFIAESPCAYVIVSHDVRFLDRLVTGVLALEAGRAVRVKGNYTAYTADRVLREEHQRAAWEAHQKKVAATQAFADRFRAKATKARQVQSRLKHLEREEAPLPPPPAGTGLTLALPQPERSGRRVAALEGVDAGYGETLVYRGLSLAVERGDKVALIGANGGGKSTLLKLLAGLVAPRGGAVTYGHNVRVSYFAQHQLEQLDPGRTVLEELRQVPGERTDLELRGILGAFLFSGDAVEKKVAVLSGGEKSRLALAKLLVDPGNFFLLDEPTNHLDLQACEVLKGALERFEGTLCFITHDRDLINRVATRVLYVEQGAVREYLGNFDDFAAQRAREADAAGPGRRDEPGGEAERLGRRDQRRLDAERRAEERRQAGPLRKQVGELEAAVGAAEERLGGLDGALADPALYADPTRAATTARERAEAARRVELLTAEWEAAATALDALERALAAEGR